MHDPQHPVRIDRWLWAARLVKTRALAAEAARGGRVEINGTNVKAGKEVCPGDTVEVVSGPLRRTVVVCATALRRGPAKEAEQLYAETAESVAARERLREERRLTAPAPGAGRPGGRPTKRDRRRFERARGER